VYATGWAGSGPVGVIVNTMGDSIRVAKAVVSDIGNSKEMKRGSEAILEILKGKG